MRDSVVADLTKHMVWATVLFPLVCLLDLRVITYSSEPNDRSNAVALTALIETKPPIVLVVFDELPLSTLLGDDGRVNRHRYPHLRRFSEKATFFPNAGTVMDRTALALPAILTGRYPEDPHAAPTSASYPNSLFTWLRNDYRIVTSEYITRFCPEGACEEIRRREERPERLWTTMVDLKWVLLHRWYPPEWWPHLPGIQSRTRDFGDVLTPKNPAVEEFLALIRSIDGRDGSLYFLHSRLPHAPWMYTSRGARYSSGDLAGLPEGRWVSQAWLTVQAFQRHILQTQFVDYLFGRLLDRLEEHNILDRALIIVTADHGTRFSPKMSRRDLTGENYIDILNVPFFVKRPSQQDGRVDGRPVETIDVVATVADIVERPVPWVSDGRSVFDSSSPQRTERKAAHFDEEYQNYPARLSSEATVLRKLSLFGSGVDPESLFRVGDRHGLVGCPLSGLDYDESALSAVVDEGGHYDDVRLDKGLVPVWLRGRILGADPRGKAISVAVALNRVIVATTETYVTRDEVRFASLLPEKRFRDGENGVEMFVIEESATGVRLSRIAKIE